MFGMGFMEILFIAVIAIIALGPDKLPNALVQMAKMFKKIKHGIDDAKSSLDSELHISQMKEEANSLKANLENTTMKLNSGLSDIVDETKQTKKPKRPKKSKTPKKQENIEFEKPKTK